MIQICFLVFPLLFLQMKESNIESILTSMKKAGEKYAGTNSREYFESDSVQIDTSIRKIWRQVLQRLENGGKILGADTLILFYTLAPELGTVFGSVWTRNTFYDFKYEPWNADSLRIEKKVCYYSSFLIQNILHEKFSEIQKKIDELGRMEPEYGMAIYYICSEKNKLVTKFWWFDSFRGDIK